MKTTRGWICPQSLLMVILFLYVNPGKGIEITERWHRESLPVVGDRLRVGTRLIHRSLLDSRRGIENSFLGSITELDLEQTHWPSVFFAQWFFNEYVALEAGWERFRVKTITEFNRHSDGTFHLSGPLLLVLGRYPNHSHFVPVAGVGLAFMEAEFENDPVWHNGFSYERIEDYHAWVAAGCAPWPNNGYQRTIEASDTRGFVITAGCNFTILKRLSGEFMLRYMDMEVDAHYYLSRYGRIFDDRGITPFPMSSISCSVGVVWAF
ncbi:MAG: hypothetical protein N2255_07555 [Kiritimatiellae bacterium]|nr:hypothetical protein [Kiritimatiellia bacterium]